MKSHMNNPFYQERLIKEAREISTRNGFELVEHRKYLGKISALANKEPYARDVVIKAFDDWRDVIIFFTGYEQHTLERGQTKCP